MRGNLHLNQTISTCTYLFYKDIQKIELLCYMLFIKCMLYYYYVILLYLLPANELFQWPRFVGVKTGSYVTLSCVDKASKKGDKEVSWRKALSAGNPDHPLEQSKDVNFGQRTGRMTLSRMQTEHSGVYFCYINGTKGPGSEVQVHSECPNQTDCVECAGPQ